MVFKLLFFLQSLKVSMLHVLMYKAHCLINKYEKCILLMDLFVEVNVMLAPPAKGQSAMFVAVAEIRGLQW